MTKPRKLPDIAAVAGLLALSLVGYGHLLERGHTPYSPYSDAIAVTLGVKDALYRSWSEHARLPFWQANQMSGGAALTNPQALYLNPLHALFFFLPPAAALGPTLWLHFALMGLGFYWIGRRLGLDVLPAAFMGSAALFSFKLLLAAYAGWLSLLPSIALSPLLVLSVFELVQRPSLGRGLAFAALSALCLHAGHIQIIYYASLASACYLVTQAVVWVRARQYVQLRAVVALTLAGSVLALALCSYLIIPILSELPLLSRSQATYPFFLSNHATTLAQLGTFVVPELLGTPRDGSYPDHELWEDDAYFGLVPLLLAAFGAIASQRPKLARALSIGFVLSVLLAMDSPLLHLLWIVLPGMKLFHCPSRTLFIATYAGIALAGLGLEAILAHVRTSGARVAIVLSLIVVVSAEGSFYARRYLTVLPQEQVLPQPAYQARLSQDHALFRVAPIGRATLNYGWAAHLGLQLVTGYEPYSLRHYGTYFDLVTSGRPGNDMPRPFVDFDQLARPDLLEALNVKYLVAPVRLRFPDDRFALIAQWPDQPMFDFYVGRKRGAIFLYRHEHPHARAFWAASVLGVPDEASALRAIVSASLDHLAVVQTAQAIPPPLAASAADRVQVIGFEPGRLDLKLDHAAPRFLVISEVWHPGWSAQLDGRALPLYRTNYALLGAFVPAGAGQRLELVWKPLRWDLALAISLSAVGVFFVVALIVLRRRFACA